MNFFAWICVAGIVFFVLLPLFKKEPRTRAAVIKAALTLVIIVAIITAIYALYVPLLFAMLVLVVAVFLINARWYSRKGLISLGVIILITGGSAYLVLRQDPGYVLNHLANHPESSSFVFAKDGKTLVSYQAEKRRPLASTVKIIIAVEYAEQAAAGKIDPQRKVSLDEPRRFYLKNTDGMAHPIWLEKMKEENRIDGGRVTLHDIAKGMIKYSSNANTDYLLSILGVDQVNERIYKLGLEGHEPMYPIVSAMLIPNQIKKEDMDEEELESLLRNISDDEYQKKALQIDKEIQSGELRLSDISYDGSLAIQRVWSDRLPGATANDYQKLMAMINEENTFSSDVEEYLRDLLEWPMESPGNENRFVHFGAKGGSTASVLTHAMYAEDHEGNNYELIMFSDDMSLWQSFKLGWNHNEFIKKVFDEPDYWKKIQEELSS